MTFSLNTPTYSLGIACMKVGKQSLAKTDVLPDQDLVGNAVATAAGMAYAMQTGSTFLVKGPDGSQTLCRFDPEHSTPANPVVIRVK